MKCNQLKSIISEADTNSIIETKFDSLYEVQLMNNTFKAIDSNSFKEMKNLVEICLSNNKLELLDVQILTDQINLTHLS